MSEIWNMASGSAARVTALVLAASRRGSDDPVAALVGESHKCLVKVAGTPMLERVVQALLDSKVCARILISIESEQILRRAPGLAAWLDDGTIETVASGANLADSVLAVANQAQAPLPLLVTTADNALHTPELVVDFVTSALTGRSDIAVGMTREDTVRNEFPDEPLGFFRFSDGGYSFCNLFLLRSAASFRAAEVFRSGGQFRKKPWRILKTFGVMNLILYRLGRISLKDALRRISNSFGIGISACEVPWPFAPIDVDNPRTFALSERILQQRAETQNGN